MKVATASIIMLMSRVINNKVLHFESIVSMLYLHRKSDINPSLGTQ